MLRKIIVTGDISRIGIRRIDEDNFIIEHNQTNNIRFIYYAIRFALLSSTGITPTIFLGDTDSELINEVSRDFLKNENLMETNDWPNHIYGLHAINYESIDERLMSALDKIIDPDDLIFGFEMSPGMRKWIETRGIKFINLTFHPLRFLSDLYFLITSNDYSIVDALSEFSLTDSDLEFCKDNFFAIASRNTQIIPWIPEGTCVIASQTLSDQSVISESKFLNLNFFKERIICESEKHPFSIILPHPYGDPMWKIEEDVLRSIGGNAMIMPINGYQLISDPRVSKVISISSGLGCEAKCLGKDVDFLLENPIDRATRSSMASITVNANIIRQPIFWSKITESFGLNAKLPIIANNNSPSFRQLLGHSWSFEEFISKKPPPNERRWINLGGLKGNNETIIRSAFKLTVDTEILSQADFDYHSQVITSQGKGVFFRSLLDSDAAKNRGVRSICI